MANRVLQRRDTAANWAAANPILAEGELGIITDTKGYKIGDGETHWNDLPFPSNPTQVVDNVGTSTTVAISQRMVTEMVGLDDYPVFSVSEAYSKGKVVNYNGKLYKFTADHAAGDLTQPSWEETSMADNSKTAKVKLEYLDTLFTGSQSAGTAGTAMEIMTGLVPTVYDVMGSQNVILGKLFAYSDSMRHVITQVLFTSMTLDDNGALIDTHNDGITHMYYRTYGVMAPSLTNGKWTEWKQIVTELDGDTYMQTLEPGDTPITSLNNFNRCENHIYFASTPGTYTKAGNIVVEDGELALILWSWRAKAFSKKTIYKGNISNIVQETGDSETAVMSQRAVTEKLNTINDKIKNDTALINHGDAKNIDYRLLKTGSLKNTVIVRTASRDNTMRLTAYGKLGKVELLNFDSTTGIVNTNDNSLVGKLERFSSYSGDLRKSDYSSGYVYYKVLLENIRWFYINNVYGYSSCFKNISEIICYGAYLLDTEDISKNISDAKSIDITLNTGTGKSIPLCIANFTNLITLKIQSLSSKALKAYGNITDLPISLKTFSISSCDTSELIYSNKPYTHIWNEQFATLSINTECTSMTTDMVDALLIDLAWCVKATEGTRSVSLPKMKRTAASDDAVAALEELGFTVNVPLQAEE